jgi:hypothetical protein
VGLLYKEACNTRNEEMSREWHIKRDRKFRSELRTSLLVLPRVNIRYRRPNKSPADGGLLVNLQSSKCDLFTGNQVTTPY